MCFVDEIRKNFRQSLTDQFQIVKGAWGRHKKSTQSLVVSIIYVSILKNRITLKIIVFRSLDWQFCTSYRNHTLNSRRHWSTPPIYSLPLIFPYLLIEIFWCHPGRGPGLLTNPVWSLVSLTLRNRTLKPDLHGGWIERIKVLNKSYRDPYTIVSPSDLQTFQRKLLLSIMKRVICNKNAKLWRFDPFFCNEWILAWSGFFSEKIRVNEMSQLI